MKNDEYISKLRELERLSDELMCYKLADESPLVDIIDREGSHYNILLCASQFAEKEIERVKNLTKASLIESMKS